MAKQLTDEQLAAIRAAYTKIGIKDISRAGGFLMDREHQASPVAWCAYQDLAEAIVQILPMLPTLLADLEEAREENRKLREFRKVIYDHLDKALTAMDRWPRDSAPREKWLIRWTYLLQAVSAGPRIEDVLDSVAVTEREEKA